MAKPNTDPITDGDLINYLTSASDFAFEQEIFRALLDIGFEAQHGGTYTDPSTGTPREFDIRGRKAVRDGWSNNNTMEIRVAVECKNINSSSPLLVECVPRTREERFHEIIHSQKTNSPSVNWHKRKVTSDSVYREGHPVGKSCCQVKRSSNDLTGTDSGVYVKWAQALASIFDLFEMSKVNRNQTSAPQLTALIPFVVVPDDRLWKVEYDGHGKRISDACKTDHVSYWVNKPLSDSRDTKAPLHWFSVSHIEFCTKSGLARVLNKYLTDASEQLFSTDG